MEIITQDGEVIEGTELVPASTSLAVQLQRAEIDQLVSTARAYPRSLKRVQTSIMTLATLDEESAEECMYALPRGGKPIKGPSIRFAEILKQSYGNCQAAARVVHVDRDEKYVEAEGVFVDLESNSRSTARVRRRITDRQGRLYNDDMIIVTGNAACSIAMRNAILAGIPKPLWRKAYDAVQATITGDITTLSENRTKAYKALAAFGLKPEQIFQALGVAGEEEITVDHIGTLRGMYAALKNGEATVEELLGGFTKLVSQHTKVADPLADEPAPKRSAASSSEPDAADAATGQETQTVAANPSSTKEAVTSTVDVGRTTGQAGAANTSADDEPAPKRTRKKPAEVPAAEPSVAQTEVAKSPENRNSGDVAQVAAGETANTAGADAAPADAAPRLTEDEAYEMGRNAKVRGQGRSAMPDVIKMVDDLKNAWLVGWSEAPTDD